MTLAVTYFLACMFYYISFQVNEQGLNKLAESFTEVYIKDDEDEHKTGPLIKTLYFILTTLSTVGYGDMYPICNYEKILMTPIMVFGVAYFSYIMGVFSEIIQQFKKNNGKQESPMFKIHNWMTLLSRFRDNKPLPEKMLIDITNHFAHSWSEERISFMNNESKILEDLPYDI